ncbi:unnamed protein product [Linum tenue]|uniref:Major facilitator superfamily (MFS) profile domain-containing protein n=1 Tax=Linum tenue TaxID=586396 RepID=A0AAV0M709_9ROSI|nr:unnamed protein product [Linum tenue]
MEPFLKKFFPSVLRQAGAAETNIYCQYDSQLLTAFTSSLYIAGLVASLVASRVTAALGRKNTMVLGGLTFFAGGAINGGAVNVAMLILGRILLGLGVGFTNQVAAVLVAGTGASGTEHISKELAVAVLILLCTYGAGFGWSWGPLSWLIPSEIFPIKIRTTGQGISQAVNFATTFALSQSFLAMLCHLKYGAFLFYAGWIATMTLFVMLFLPETKGIPLDSMQGIWEQHWYWRRFVSTTVSA